MPSLVEEITKLHQLHKDGILTIEEFTQAKHQLLAGPSAASAPAPQQQQQHTSQTSSAPVVVAADEEFFDLSHVGAHASAYGLLKTIFTNIINEPQQEKFRRLKVTNERLAAGLFSNPGALPFLQKKVGFQFEKETSTIEQNSNSSSSSSSAPAVTIELDSKQFIVLPLSVTGSQVASALSYIEACEERDAKATREAGDLGLRKRSLLLDLRREKCASSLKAGELKAFLRNTFQHSEAHFGEEGLLRSIESVKLVKTILTNAATTFDTATAPITKNYRRVPLSNAKAVDLLIRRDGALELLIEMGGWVLRGRHGSSSPLVPIWAPTSSATTDEKKDTTNNNVNINLVPEELILPVEVSRDVVTAALDYILNDLLPFLLEEEKRQRENDIIAAKEAAIAELRADREKRRREAEKIQRLEELRTKAANGESGGERIPIAEAIKRLLGTDKNDDVTPSSSSTTKY